MIEDIEEENMVQMIIDGALVYFIIGRMLEDKRKCLFWSPCAAWCLDLIFFFTLVNFCIS